MRILMPGELLCQDCDQHAVLVQLGVIAADMFAVGVLGQATAIGTLSFGGNTCKACDSKKSTGA